MAKSIAKVVAKTITTSDYSIYRFVTGGLQLSAKRACYEPSGFQNTCTVHTAQKGWLQPPVSAFWRGALARLPRATAKPPKRQRSTLVILCQSLNRWISNPLWQTSAVWMHGLMHCARCAGICAHIVQGSRGVSFQVALSISSNKADYLLRSWSVSGRRTLEEVYILAWDHTKQVLTERYGQAWFKSFTRTYRTAFIAVGTAHFN